MQRLVDLLVTQDLLLEAENGSLREMINAIMQAPLDPLPAQDEQASSAVEETPTKESSASADAPEAAMASPVQKVINGIVQAKGSIWGEVGKSNVCFYINAQFSNEKTVGQFFVFTSGKNPYFGATGVVTSVFMSPDAKLATVQGTFAIGGVIVPIEFVVAVAKVGAPYGSMACKAGSGLFETAQYPALNSIYTGGVQLRNAFYF